MDLHPGKGAGGGGWGATLGAGSRGVMKAAGGKFASAGAAGQDPGHSHPRPSLPSAGQQCSVS